MNVVGFVIALGLGIALAEARVSNANARRLLGRGAFAPPGDLHSVATVLYPACLLIMGAEGIWRSAQKAGAPADGPAWFASGVLLFVASKALKYWAIRALGWRWTFRVLVLPGAPLVATGPYQYVAHPNYMAVVGELAATAMMCGASVSGSACVVVYALVMWLRARFEDRVLRLEPAGQVKE